MEKNIITIPQGEVIFRQNSIQLWFYEIVSGAVDIYADYGEPSQKLLTTMQPGQTFGEMGLLGYRGRSATAVAAAETQVIKIGEDELEGYIANDPERFLGVMRQLTDRTRELTRDYNEALHTAAGIQKNKKDKGLLARIARFAKIGRA